MHTTTILLSLSTFPSVALAGGKGPVDFTIQNYPLGLSPDDRIPITDGQVEYSCQLDHDFQFKCNLNHVWTLYCVPRVQNRGVDGLISVFYQIKTFGNVDICCVQVRKSLREKLKICFCSD